jgi:hypothetical protein
MTSGNDTLDFSSIGTSVNVTETTVSGTNVNTTFSNVDTVIGSSAQDDTYTVDFANINNLIFDGNTGNDNVDITTGIDVSSSSQSILDTQFDNIESIDISGAIAGTGNTFEITQANIDAWNDSANTSSGNINLTISTADNTNNNIKLTGTTDADGASPDTVTDRTSFTSGETYNWDVDTSITFTIV